MKTLSHNPRIARLIAVAIDTFQLDLGGIGVLTEAGSGAYALTPAIAALAGAERVVAITRDSRFGTAAEVQAHARRWAAYLGAPERIEFVTGDATTFAHRTPLVTNLGFVRPIDAKLIERLPEAAAVSLMWEPWELRKEEIDLEACRRRGVPVMGTAEDLPSLRIFDYVGVLAVRLLLEREIEIFRSRLLLIGSGVFGDKIDHYLRQLGAQVVRLVPPDRDWRDALHHHVHDASLDAVVVAEHRWRGTLLGREEHRAVAGIAAQGVPLIHLCGVLDYHLLDSHGIDRHPSREVAPGYMTVATDYLGPRPVIDLHTAGLKVGAALVEGMRSFADPTAAVSHAREHAPARPLPSNLPGHRLP